MRLIDEAELKEWVENWLYQNKYYHPHAKRNSIPCSELYDILERMPTIDAVEVVRCRDCKHWNPNGIGFCTIHDIRPSQLDMADWFCADGERKDDGQIQQSN